MTSHFDMLLAVFDRAALMLICLFFLTRTRPFRQLLQKDEHTRHEKAVVTAIFSLFSTWLCRIKGVKSAQHGDAVF